MNRLSPFFRVFELAPRSLHLFRVLLGTTLILDMSLRLMDFGAHYSDDGVLPFNELTAIWHAGTWSVHTLLKADTFQIFLFILTIGLGVLLVLGKYIRLVSFGIFLLLLSLHNRNPLVLNGGDILLRMLFFWSIFLPWETKVNEQKSRHWGNVFLIFQIIFVYFFSGWLKNGIDWENGTALYYVLNLDMHSTSLGKMLLTHTEWLPFLTKSVVFIERYFWVLFIVPFKTSLFRTLGLAIFSVLHISFAICLNIGLFPLISLIALVPFFPEVFYKRLRAFDSLIIPKADHRAIGAHSKRKSFFQVLGGMALIIVLGWNLLSIGITALPSVFDRLVFAIGLQQNWALFSPNPIKNDGWYVMEGLSQNDQSVDLWTGEETDWTKPKDVNRHYHNNRWRKFFKVVKAKKYAELRPILCQYFCVKNEEIESVCIYFMQEKSLPPGEIPKINKRLFWKMDCNDLKP